MSERKRNHHIYRFTDDNETSNDKETIGTSSKKKTIEERINDIESALTKISLKINKYRLFLKDKKTDEIPASLSNLSNELKETADLFNEYAISNDKPSKEKEKLEETKIHINNGLYRLKLKVGMYEDFFEKMNKTNDDIQEFLKRLLAELGSYYDWFCDALDDNNSSNKKRRLSK